MIQVYANYGAMYPTETLTVHTIADGIGQATNQFGEGRRVEFATVRDSRPASGSPIGLYWNEMDAY